MPIIKIPAFLVLFCIVLQFCMCITDHQLLSYNTFLMDSILRLNCNFKSIGVLSSKLRRKQISWTKTIYVYRNAHRSRCGNKQDSNGVFIIPSFGSCFPYGGVTLIGTYYVILPKMRFLTTVFFSMIPVLSSNNNYIGME